MTGGRSQAGVSVYWSGRFVGVEFSVGWVVRDGVDGQFAAMRR
ncbi:hypothetical protein ACLMAJ_16990 [Nocardia sp. KC 131]